MHGWSDNTTEDAFVHTVRLEDDDRAVELQAVCGIAPAYEIRRVTARAHGGAVAAEALAGIEQLVGARMVGGFTRRAAEVAGNAAGAALLVDAAIEVARLARQVTQVPRERTAGIPAHDGRACWELDTSTWPDLVGSCFTYSRTGDALFASRVVTPTLPPTFYSPAPGAERVFVRRKLARLVQTGLRLDLFSSMHDDVHGFDLHFEIDTANATIVAADSITSRLPYRGLCDEPQGRVKMMVGQTVDELLRKRSQSLIGGETGCAQLYDLTNDV